MKSFLREYLSFNRQERNGLFVLLSIILLMIAYLQVSPFFLQSEITDFSKFEKEAMALSSSLKREHDSLERKKEYHIDHPHSQPGNKAFSSVKKPELFLFDPNVLSVEDWKRLGFTEGQIRSIKKYQAAGGIFKSKMDLKKMYVISEKQYLSLEPFILIAPTVSTKKKIPASELVELMVDINAADHNQLLSIKGIGNFYASEIMKYRELLGGFVDVKQLLEIWKMDSLKLEGMKGQIWINKMNVRKININASIAKELKHPYLNWNMVNAIYNYRQKHGNYKSTPEIKNTGLVDEKTFSKIAPYLIIE